jgi:GT2 family glycosyltransferase
MDSEVSVILTEKNGGYAYGNNLAIRATLKSSSVPDYFL